MKFVPKDWWDDSTKIGWPLALEPEGGGDWPALNWETMSVCHCTYTSMPAFPDKWISYPPVLDLLS